MKTLFLNAALLLIASCATHSKPVAWKPLQPPDIAQPLSLDRCLDLARSNDIQMADWRARLDAARAELLAAREIPNPTISLLWEDVGLKDPDTGQGLASHTYGVSYPIFFWWTRGPKIAAARAQKDAQTQSVWEDQRRLAADIGAAYFGLVGRQRAIRVAQEQVDDEREKVRLAHKEEQLGAISPVDVRLTETELLDVERNLNEERARLRIEQLALAFALGVDRPIFPDVLDPGDQPAMKLSDAPTTSSVPSSLASIALQTDPQWAKAKALRQAAEADLTTERRNVLPSGDAQAATGGKTAPEGRSREYSLDIPIPLFNWNQSGIRRAEAALQQARAEEEKVRRSILSEIAQSWEKAKLAANQYAHFAKPLAEAWRRNAEGAARLFAAGEITYLDLLKVQHDALVAERSAVDAWQEAASANWSLECAAGMHDWQAFPAQLAAK